MSARSLPRTAQAERRQAIADAYATGLSSREVAERFGTSGGRVREIAKLYGVARPVGRPRAA